MIIFERSGPVIDVLQFDLNLRRYFCKFRNGAANNSDCKNMYSMRQAPFGFPSFQFHSQGIFYSRKGPFGKKN